MTSAAGRPEANRAFRLSWAAALAIALAPGLAFTAHAQSGRPGPASVAPVAEKLLDAVVNISTSQRVKGPSGVPLPKVPKGSPFEDLFEDFFNRKDGEGAHSRKVASLGSGFVIDGKEGLIVTNYHVIDGADEITANFADGSALKVDKVLGRDSKTDLALLKVTPKKPLAEVRFGSVQGLRVGDWVMAIGNPFGLGGSVSVGIISAKQRDIQTGPYDDYLQTDAAINKGNSGGPLFDMNGEVVGINTAIISPTGGSIGIGFAVPADVAMVVIDQLRKYGRTRRGWIGVQIQSVTEDIAASLGVEPGHGALISKVAEDGPAAKAGIVAGDVIVTFDGKAISRVRMLPRVVAQAEDGKSVEVVVMRKGERKVINVMVGRLAEDESGGDAKEADKDSKTSTGRIGLTVAPISEALRSTHGIGARINGLVVTAVEAGSGGAQRGIKVGEVVVEAGQTKVKTVAELEAEIAKAQKAGRRAVRLIVSDGKGNIRILAVPIK
ncbi:MAG: Do family serine endopeptidase [Hyphomicrobiaceae bacterium]